MLDALQEILTRFWTDLAARTTGTLSFRFVLQPTMAALLAIRDGLKDARTGRSPYFWTILTNREERAASFREGIRATTRIIVLGLVMDTIYQLLELRSFYPGEALFVAFTLACVPYFVIRGPAARLARRWRKHRSAERTPPK
jgi:hypothetical protein